MLMTKFVVGLDISSALFALEPSEMFETKEAAQADIDTYAESGSTRDFKIFKVVIEEVVV